MSGLSSLSNAVVEMHRDDSSDDDGDDRAARADLDDDDETRVLRSAMDCMAGGVLDGAATVSCRGCSIYAVLYIWLCSYRGREEGGLGSHLTLSRD